MTEVRKTMFPYGMAKNPDGSWTLFNRNYKPVGVISKDWEEWDAPRHKMHLKGIGPAKLKKLDIHGLGTGDQIYFYDDGTVPTRSAANMKSYQEKLTILMKLETDPIK